MAERRCAACEVRIEEIRHLREENRRLLDALLDQGNARKTFGAFADAAEISKAELEAEAAEALDLSGVPGAIPAKTFWEAYRRTHEASGIAFDWKEATAEGEEGSAETVT